MNKEAFDELCADTLTRGDAAFIHQHVVDAFAAQTADETTKPIKLTFALVGLQLCCERQFDGRKVQRAHMWLARVRRAWPRLPLPCDRGALTVTEARDAAIHTWAASVWEAYRTQEPAAAETIRAITAELPADRFGYSDSAEK